MRHFSSPRHVRYVQETVDPIINLNEGTVVGEIAHHALHNGVWGIVGSHFLPRILLGLLHAQRDFLLLFVDGKHNHLHLIAGLHELTRMADALGPTHLADMHQAFDAILEFDECSIAHHVYDRTIADRGHRILVGDLGPWAGGALLDAEGNFFTLTIDVQHLHFKFLID